ncbi:DNA methyltransferase [Halochromatium salexigens]|uniref:DNA methylase n=1 Tax=Halochromatium salexigens TaxID=49447 RepID=A0AAJ0XHK5_HALSE|nr:DNA methyltransferase [Halochromatium salexigens]MBK5931770.1 DNA methylase [Halochromatium salexigens]
MDDRQQSLDYGSTDDQTDKPSGPVTCLGMTFENDEARRAHFTEELRKKLQDPEFRKIEGFPIGSDEDILALSDPPYYTACPNPWIVDFIAEWETSRQDAGATYHRTPFAIDVSEGKTDALYKAHSYHTKVPHLAIVPSILHYTEPGDLVLDGFCGSGMTGVAAQFCGSAPAAYRRKLESRWRDEGMAPPQWGARRVILNDLSPAATFIAANYNVPFDVAAFAKAGRQLLDEVQAELGWMYGTHHSDGQPARIDYSVWSEVFSCPDCAGEMVFLAEALDPKTKRVKEEFPCPHCGSELNKRRLGRLYEMKIDPILGEAIQTPMRRPALIQYSIGKQKYEKKPDDKDLAVLKRIEALPLPAEVPTTALPYMHMTHERARMDRQGITHIHHFFLSRAAHALAALWRKAKAHPEARTRNMLLYFVEQAIWGMSVLNRYSPSHFSQVNRQMTGVYYIASQYSECSPSYNLSNKLAHLVKSFKSSHAQANYSVIEQGSAAALSISSNHIDHIFTDPPFGENIYYADLNFLVESWHGVITDAKPEAIVDKAKKKAMPEYQQLMERCFREYHRVLKPGRWMTVVFHNSRNAVWNTIQEAMLAAGFVVADVRTLDKQQGSYRQVTSTAVKQDLVISAYKPNGGLEQRFALVAGTEDGVWDFIRTHLKQLPVFVARDGEAEVIAERSGYFLFDRMVAFHVQRGVTVPLDAADFHQGLTQRFDERDAMFFLPEQAAEYDRKRLNVAGVRQLSLDVIDEASAIQWLRQQLKEKPTTYQDIQPRFMERTRAGWLKHEQMPELNELLELNFLSYDGKGPVPEQIHAYLSTNWKELRNLPKDDPALVTKARDRWYVPDPNKAGDLEKLREKALLKEFEEYKAVKKKLKVFRLEAVRAGFKKAWQERDYAVIVAVADKIPNNVLEEDPKLLMWYDQAVTRMGGDA